jgi:hypothetical protein
VFIVTVLMKGCLALTLKEDQHPEGTEGQGQDKDGDQPMIVQPI